MSNVSIYVEIFLLSGKNFFLCDWFDSKHFWFVSSILSISVVCVSCILIRFMVSWIVSLVNQIKIVWFVSFFTSGLIFFKVLNRFTNIWIISTFVWAGLIWITLCLIRINLHSSSFILFYMFDTIQVFMIRFNTTLLAKILHLPLISIYIHIIPTPKLLNRLQLSILSLQTYLSTSFHVKHFF
jgi:hypothetical protein